MKKISLLIIMIVSVIAITGCNKSNNISISEKNNTHSIDKKRENYKSINYEKWNHDDKKVAYTEKVKIEGKVVQVSDGDTKNSKILRVALDDDYDKIVYCYIDKGYYKNVIAEDDQIVGYGSANGLFTYESVMKAEVTVPYMDLYFYDINDEIIKKESEHFEKVSLFNQDGITFDQVTNDTFTIKNNSDKDITVSVESLDVDGQIIDEFNFENLYGDMKPGQYKNVKLKDKDNLMTKGKTVNFTINISDTDYNTLYSFDSSIILKENINN